MKPPSGPPRRPDQTIEKRRISWAELGRLMAEREAQDTPKPKKPILPDTTHVPAPPLPPDQPERGEAPLAAPLPEPLVEPEPVTEPEPVIQAKPKRSRKPKIVSVEALRDEVNRTPTSRTAFGAVIRLHLRKRGTTQAKASADLGYPGRGVFNNLLSGYRRWNAVRLAALLVFLKVNTTTLRKEMRRAISE